MAVFLSQPPSISGISNFNMCIFHIKLPIMLKCWSFAKSSVERRSLNSLLRSNLFRVTVNYSIIIIFIKCFRHIHLLHLIQPNYPPFLITWVYYCSVLFILVQCAQFIYNVYLSLSYIPEIWYVKKKHSTYYYFLAETGISEYYLIKSITCMLCHIAFSFLVF